jgi:hypothetical protein
MPLAPPRDAIWQQAFFAVACDAWSRLRHRVCITSRIDDLGWNLRSTNAKAFDRQPTRILASKSRLQRKCRMRSRLRRRRCLEKLRRLAPPKFWGRGARCGLHGFCAARAQLPRDPASPICARLERRRETEQERPAVRDLGRVEAVRDLDGVLMVQQIEDLQR